MTQNEYITIFIGVLTGALARFFMLRIDFRQYPSYPQGYVIHLTLGAIASGLGAVVIPAVLNKEYAAITFLAMAIQQFREVRRMERDSLETIEADELVKRGHAYIEDISKKFESRNYVAMLTALLTSGAIYVTHNYAVGIVVGILVLFFMCNIIETKRISHIAQVKPAKVWFKEQYLMVDDIVIMNVGLSEHKEKILKYGVGAVIIPKDRNAAVTLSNLGQRQAIIHDIVSILGIRRETDEPEFIPLSRRNPDTGVVAVVAMTFETDPEGMINVINRTPLLESSKKQPSDTYTSRMLLKKE